MGKLKDEPVDGETLGGLSMTERAFRNVIAARCNQRLAQERSRLTQACAGSRAGRSSLSDPRSRVKAVLLLFTLLCGLLSIPASASTLDVCLANTANQTPVTSVHVQPQSGFSPILDEIHFARCSIDLNMYLFTSQDIVDALEHAVDRGVLVRVILEKEPFGTFGTQQEIFDRLLAIRAEVRWGPEHFTFSHAKYMVVDSSVLIVTNQNFTGAGFNSNREFGVVTTELAYVNEAALIFEADWSGVTFDGGIQHLVVSPVNSRSTIVGMIHSSTQSVWMYSEVLRDEEVTTALGNASERGVDVRILVNPSADVDDAPYFLDALGHGVDIRVLRNPYVHSKVMIVDGKRALVGSQNYSYTSLELNREIGMIITDPDSLEGMIDVYSADWSRGEPVDSVSGTLPISPLALTQVATIGRIPSVRWRVV